MQSKQATELVAKIEWLAGKRRNAEDTIQEITDLFMPYRGDITTRTSPGDRRRPLYDSYGVMVADRFTNFLNGMLYPSSSDWFKIRIPNRIGWDQEEEQALFDSSRRVMDALAASNFYVAAQTDTRDWGVLGNSALYTQHDDERANSKSDFGGLIFDPVPWSRVWWHFSHIGRPLVVVRELEMPAVEVRNFFSKSGDSLPRTVVDLARATPYEPLCLYHVVERKPKGKKGTSMKPWSSQWICKEDPSVVIRTGQFDNNPYICSRHMLMDGEQYGRGRGHIARPVMKGCNEITRQEMIALGKEMSPPFMSEEDEIAQLDLTPGGHVVVRPPKEVQPGYLKSGTDFKLIEMVRDAMHSQVNEAFLGDALGEPETQTRSAESERGRQARALARVSATSQTVVHEKLRPLAENVVDIMLAKRALPELQELIDANPEIELEFEFTSPFFTAQKAQSLLRVDAFLEKRLQRFERTSDPGQLEDIDLDALRQLERELGDVPASIFRTEEEIEMLRQARGDQAAEDRINALTQRAGNSQTQVQLRPGGSRSANADSLISSGAQVAV